ncbi:MAG: 1,4-alpha-glucan branching protein GlgB [Candidatus Borkfalkiaceae bacterium]|nr:1,4-alpha-glucan branching protein GlgB [Christensenellaceae bacterium]
MQTNRPVGKQNKNEEFPLYLFHQGTNYNAYKIMGAHFGVFENKKGVFFRTWAPRATSVSVVGDFNEWDASANVMERVTDGGVYECFVEGLKEYDNYKFAVTNGNKTVFKADPYAFHAETPPGTASKIYELGGYEWKDGEYMSGKKPSYDKPMNIYEVNLASWKRHKDGGYYTYKELAYDLVDYVVSMGYTHVEFMPVSEYPYDGSWGYQVTGYYAVSSRFGTPHDFMSLVDAFHQKGISVIVDWVPAHFPKDEHGLFEFDGSPCYENQGWDRMEHKEWGTRIFDFGRNEVESFLISNAVFLMDVFHIDGLRVDAVASMLYLDYGKKDGEWIPNVNGGNYNLEAIAFLQKLNCAVFERFQDALMIAEESTAFPLITKPTDIGGLGFNYKWNMGWMNDVLSYMQCDPYFRSGNHNKITFSMCYAFSENFILPISHDEVVHGKKSLLDKMPGNIDEKFANLRAFNAYMYSHPGKKLTFMGNEYGQFKEWNYKEGLEFFMTKFENHKKLLTFNKDLNLIYKNNRPLFEIEDSWDGFQWISPDEKNNNIIAYERKDRDGNIIVVLINFSGNVYTGYRLGVEKGKYKMILNTDDKKYGGKGKFGKKTFNSVKKRSHGKENSIKIDIPEFCGLYFVKN